MPPAECLIKSHLSKSDSLVTKRKEEAMKRSDQRSKTISVLAVIVFLSVPFNVFAADFFPLDVWEEIEFWEQNKVTATVNDVEAYSEPQEAVLTMNSVTSKMFPFDVQAELNELGGVQWATLKNWSTYNTNYGTTREDRINPYWIPEELRGQK